MIEIVIAVIGLIGGGLGTAIYKDVITRKRKAETHNLIIDNVKNIGEVYATIQEVVEETALTRFSIMKGHNSGNIPKPGEAFYSSVLYSYVDEDKNHEADKSKYQMLKLDSQYIGALVHSLSSPQKINTNSLNNGLLKNILKQEETSYAEIHFLGTYPTGMIYAVLSTDKSEFNEDHDRVLIDIAISSITDKLKPYMNETANYSE